MPIMSFLASQSSPSYTNQRQGQTTPESCIIEAAVMSEAPPTRASQGYCGPFKSRPKFSKCCTNQRQGQTPQKVAAIMGQLLCQKHPQSWPHRETGPHPSPPAGIKLSTGLSTPEDTSFRGVSLLFRHKPVPKILQGKCFPTSN